MARKLAGLTLIEVLLALAVLAVAALSLMAVFVSGLRLQSQAEELTSAVQVGRQLLERIKVSGSVPGAGFYDGRVPDPRHPSGFPPDPYPSTVIEGREFELTVAVDSKGAGLNSVTVEVWWSADQKATLQTYVYQ